MIDVMLRAGLAAFSAALSQLPQNTYLWTYDITGGNGTRYLTRTLTPRVANHRVMLHQIHRPDADPHPHNHPWSASFRILSGGYLEERLVGRRVATQLLRPGDVNRLSPSTFHRIVEVMPNTWTVGLCGPRVQDWGFLVGDVVVPWREYNAGRRP